MTLNDRKFTINTELISKYWEVIIFPAMTNVNYEMNKNTKTHYHTYTHALATFRMCQEICYHLFNRGQTEVELVAGLAALYHDVIYDPDANDNELASANHFKNDKVMISALMPFCLGIKELLEYISDLIKRTTIEDHSRTSTQGYRLPNLILLDADLSSLSADYVTFLKNNSNILKEKGIEGWNDKEGWNIPALVKCAEWLRDNIVSKRSSIYSTSYMRDKYEEKAQDNIKRLLSGDVEYNDEWKIL